MHCFDNDFYGANLRIIVAGYLRPEKNFSSKGIILRFVLKFGHEVPVRNSFFFHRR